MSQKATRELKNPLYEFKKMLKPKGFIKPYKHVELDILPIYQKGESTTLDPEEADKDSFGRPIGLGFQKDVVSVTAQKPLCLDPKDPVSRLRALEARSSMQNIALQPSPFMDKFEAIKRSNDQVNAFLQTVEHK